MFVLIFFCIIFDEMHMFAVAYINGTGGFPAEFVKMFIGEICVEFYFMEVIVFSRYIDGLARYCTKSVIGCCVWFLYILYL